MCNNKPMILLAGIGFGAETVKDADREAKDRLGMLAYVLSGFKQLREFEEFTAEIETEDKAIAITLIIVLSFSGRTQAQTVCEYKQANLRYIISSKRQK